MPSVESCEHRTMCKLKALDPPRKVKLHPLDAASRLGSELSCDKVAVLGP